MRRCEPHSGQTIISLGHAGADIRELEKVNRMTESRRIHSLCGLGKANGSELRNLITGTKAGAGKPELENLVAFRSWS